MNIFVHQTVTVACKSSKSLFKVLTGILARSVDWFAKYAHLVTKDFRTRAAVLQGGKVSSVVGACGVLGQILTLSCSAFKLMPPTTTQDRLMLLWQLVAKILGNLGWLNSGSMRMSDTHGAKQPR